MTTLDSLAEKLQSELGCILSSIVVSHNEITLETGVSTLYNVLSQLKTSVSFSCDQLIDVCAVDYLLYGEYDWETESATECGFSRGVERQKVKASVSKESRFGVVYHLLSTSLNHRIRVRTFPNESHLVVPSVHTLWKGADWFEREAYDLYGILFENHPDLRRILTDYGFIGHPFRKDFPVSGHVEMRYDATLKKVIYEPVDIEPRVLVPKVIRHDNRYLSQKGAVE